MEVKTEDGVDFNGGVSVELQRAVGTKAVSDCPTSNSTESYSTDKSQLQASVRYFPLSRAFFKG